MSSPIHYRNPRLQKIVHAKQGKAQLCLGSMELVDQDMEILANFLLRDDTKLTSLNLENNRTGPGGAEHLSLALRTNKVKYL